MTKESRASLRIAARGTNLGSFRLLEINFPKSPFVEHCVRRPGFSLEKNGCTRVKDQPKDSQHSGAITVLPAKCPKMRRQNAPLTLVQRSTSRAAPVCARFLSQPSPLPATPHPVTRAAGTPPRAAGGERDLPTVGAYGFILGFIR